MAGSHSFPTHGAWNPSPSAPSLPNGSEIEWQYLFLAFMSVSQQTFLHRTLYLVAYVPELRTLSPRSMSAIYIKPTRKSSILSLCFQYIFVSIFTTVCLELLLNSSVYDFQVHYEWWRRILKYFWMSVVVYTMLVLIFIYTYQFESFPGLWKNMTGLDENK